MATAADLIGIWSADARYGPGAQSDEILIFKPDGTGRMEFWNWQLCSADFFRWQVVSPGLVDLVGFRCLATTRLRPRPRSITLACCSP
jgi:hypothetical protein